MAIADVMLSFWPLIIFAALFIVDSAAQITMLDSLNSLEQCDVMCTTAFADSKASCLAMGISNK